MNIFKLFSRARRTKTRRPGRGASRSFYAAKADNLTYSFTGSGRSANEELKAGLRKLRMRSRQLYMDNDYVKRFLGMVKSNVVGPAGIRLQARTKGSNGLDDVADNAVIERAWADWSRPVNASTSRRQSWLDIQRMAMETVARDGEVLVVMERGFDNPYGIALNVLEADYLDEDHNRTLANGNRIIMGVEINSWNEPVAYHLTTEHPGDTSYTWAGRRYVRFPASKVVHVYQCDRPEQARGVPWLHTAIRRLNMLGGYEEAELVAARVSASKMGFFRQAGVDEYRGDSVDEEGLPITEAVPGTFENIGDLEFQSFDPTHPTTAYESFLKGVLRGASAGMGVAYEGLSNDREGVNYSSIRSGVLDERDQWRTLQQWLIDQLHWPVYTAWLESALLTGALGLPARKMDKFMNVTWQPRGWAWVDPLKDAKANADSITIGVQTRADIAASQGKDLSEMFEQLKIEQEMAARLGINISPAAPGTSNLDSGASTNEET